MKISWRAREGGLLTIFVDDESWKEGHRSILGAKPNLPQECLDLQDLQSIYDSLEYSGAKKYALHRLATKGYSTFELKEKLRIKRVSQGTIDRVCAELQRGGYLNDEEWAEAFVRSQIAKKRGPNQIKAKLKQKGVSVELREDFQESQRLGIEALLKTRHKTRNLADYHERQKVIASLVRRGFELEQILAALSQDI